ncbi:MAG: ComEA family DNA-binding protein [Lachnospiraceae bacterium]|nr:ComEA family DNA-binding protein [Lachnospiraceae bacterium]
MTHLTFKWLRVAVPVAAVVLAGSLYLMLYGRGEGRAIRSETIEAKDSLVDSHVSGEGAVSVDQAGVSGVSVDSEDPALCVHVCGQVVEEGVFFLARGSRVADAVAAAGGFTDEAATRYLNLALPVTDGMKIYVPREDEVVTAVMYTEPVTETSGPVNINTADVASLMTLSGIGERKAEDIVAYRKENGLFQTAEDIMNVPGIKTALYEKIRGDICVK